MASFLNGRTEVTRLKLNVAATDAYDPVRFGEFQTALDGKAGVTHGHTAAAIGDFETAARAAMDGYLGESPSIGWQVSGGKKVPGLRIKTGTAARITADGLEIVVGESGVAPYAHTHAQLHDPVTTQDSDAIRLVLVGQLLRGDFLTHPDQTLQVTESGVRVNPNLVTLLGYVPPNNHLPLTVRPTSSLALAMDGPGQVLSGTVTVDPAPAPGYGRVDRGPSGLRIPLGTTPDTAAAGDHAHAVATENNDGFLSTDDKRALNRVVQLQQVTQSVSFSRHDVLPQGSYVGGRHRWGQAMQILEAHLTARGGALPVRLGVEVDGVVMQTIDVPAGTYPQRVLNQKSFASLFVEADKYVQIVCESGVANIQNAPEQIDVTLKVRSTLVSPVRINAGGAAQTPYAADAYYSGGTTQSTANAINRSTATDPAPEAVYKSWRAIYYQNTPLEYTFAGLPLGIPYKVRLHFAENYWTWVGAQVFGIHVYGLTEFHTLHYDIYNAAGLARFKAVVREYTMQADAGGQIKVSLTPERTNDGEYHCSINAIELVPQV